MSLAGKTIWVVGGVGTVGRGLARGLLQTGATVIVNSRRQERLDRIQDELQYPERLVAIHGSLKPDFSPETIQQALKNRLLDHVVAHGAVRYWTTKVEDGDETHSLKSNTPFLRQSCPEFAASSSALASFHFSALQELMPRMVDGTYTFVTGDGCGHPSSRRTPWGELNAHHVRGLAAAIRRELKDDPNVQPIELRIGFHVPQSTEEVLKNQESGGPRPISEEIGDLCAGLIAASHQNKTKVKDLVKVDSEEQLNKLLREYPSGKDETIGTLPSICDFAIRPLHK